MKHLLLVLLISFSSYGQRKIQIGDYLCLPCSEYTGADSIHLTNTFDWNFSDPLYPNGLLRVKIIHRDSLSICKNDMSVDVTGNEVSLTVIDKKNQNFEVLNHSNENCSVSVFEFTNIQKIENIKFSINNIPIELKDHRVLVEDDMGLAGSFSKKDGFMFTSFGSRKRHWNGNIVQSHLNLSEIRSRRYYTFYASGKPKKVEYFHFGFGTYRIKYLKRNGKTKKDILDKEFKSFCENN